MKISLNSFMPPITGLKKSNYVLLIVPATTFCLGIWQWRRHHWKTNLLNSINEGLTQPPIPFPIENLAELDRLEYRKVHIKGNFLFKNQFQIKWRSRLDGKQNEFDSSTGEIGSQIITPLKIDGTDLIIMVNRGWMPSKDAEAEINSGSQKPSCRAEFNAMVRKSEKPKWFLKNQPEEGIWVYKDIELMAKFCNSMPILVDAEYRTARVNNDGNIVGPIGGQTNTMLRNDHFNYMLQWFAMTIIGLFMWYHRFGAKAGLFRKLPNVAERNPFNAERNPFRTTRNSNSQGIN